MNLKVPKTEDTTIVVQSGFQDLTKMLSIAAVLGLAYIIFKK